MEEEGLSRQKEFWSDEVLVKLAKNSYSGVGVGYNVQHKLSAPICFLPTKIMTLDNISDHYWFIF